MTKTSEKIIQEFTGKDNIEIHQFIYDIAKDNFTLQTKDKIWFSEQELNDKLKEAEKSINKKIIHYRKRLKQKHWNTSIAIYCIQELGEAKQIINDCFGVRTMEEGDDYADNDEINYKMLKESNAEENDLARMFDDVNMKLKAIAETLQGQIEELRERIQELENEGWRKKQL